MTRSNGPAPSLDHFYRDACHGALSRRSVIAGAVGAAGSLLLAPRRSAAGGAPEASRALILAHATRPDDPWALVHGVRALGKGFAVAGDGPAVDYVLSRFLEERVVHGVRHLAFPLDLEAHANAFLKTLLEVGVAPEFSFAWRGRRRRLQEVIDGARALFRFSDSTDRNTIAWSLIGLSLATPPERRSWTNAWGERVDLGRVAEAGLEAIEAASAPLQDARRRGVVPARQAPIQNYTCGGTHLLYSLLVAAHQGHLAGESRPRLGTLMDLLVYRLSIDVQMIDRFYQPRLATVPGSGWYHLDQRVKFVGHAFECLGLAQRHGLYRPGGADAGRVAEARAGLVSDLGRLAGLDLPSTRRDRSLHQQLVGDICHAHRGLELA
ncbi:MAG: hypothetical protein ACREMB_24875 [Candidatus Rokuibacteriota bacterium]